MAANEVKQNAPKRPNASFLWGGEGDGSWDFLVFCVPILFHMLPSRSQRYSFYSPIIPQVLHKFSMCL
jgi:hypothetical protein